MFTVTFIRHGESEDNLKGIWAGWKDAPLSELGVKQASALGQSLASTPINIIYTSPLKRAHSTALAIQQAQPSHSHSYSNTSPNSSLQPIPNPDLREQHFGVAEGKPWVVKHAALVAVHSSTLTPTSTADATTAAVDETLAELFAQGIFPVLPTRTHRFPEGESLDDLASRAERALRECALIHLAEHVASGGVGDMHVAVASHGLCISELMSALVRLDPHVEPGVSYRGLWNTAWSRAIIRMRDDYTGPFDILNPPPLQVTVTHFNYMEHLNGLVPVKAAVETADAAEQAKARAFFGGASL
ncbi:hypothetical protein AX17_002196 [Amanita inopinata Kibby_2008]|nr:hypothetical protein AX17_002196 [Amanita inopinata Kibby_2008]